MNLFVGVVISKFNQEKEKYGQNFLLTPMQREWLKVQSVVYEATP